MSGVDRLRLFALQNKFFCKILTNTVPNPELFWSQYTGFGSQTQTPKHSKALISGVSFHQCSLSQSQESDVLSYSKHKIAKNFQGFAPGPYWGGLTVLTPDSPAAQQFFSLLCSSKNQHPPKNCWIQHCNIFQWCLIYCKIDLRVD